MTEGEREAHVVSTEREMGQFQVKIGLLHGYNDVLIGEIRGHRMPVPLAPYILGRDPPICCHKLEYMFAPSDRLVVGGMPPQMIGLGALFQDMSQVLRRIELVFLQVPLQAMMLMMAALGALMMTPSRPATIVVRSPYAGLFSSSLLYFVVIAPWWAWIVYLILPLGMFWACMYYIVLWSVQTHGRQHKACKEHRSKHTSI